MKLWPWIYPSLILKAEFLQRQHEVFAHFFLFQNNCTSPCFTSQCGKMAIARLRHHCGRKVHRLIRGKRVLTVSHLNISNVQWHFRKHGCTWRTRSIIIHIRTSGCVISPAAKLTTTFWQQKVIFRVYLPAWTKHLVSCNSVFASEDGSLIALTKRPDQHEWEEGEFLSATVLTEQHVWIRFSCADSKWISEVVVCGGFQSYVTLSLFFYGRSVGFKCQCSMEELNTYAFVFLFLHLHFFFPSWF